jgi:PST family polysaccharide transporter
MLLGITIRLQLVGLLPGAQRAMGMVRLARGLRPQPGTGKDE